MTNAALLAALEFLQDTMIAVATGGPRINDVNANFREQYGRVASELARRQIVNPLFYGDLWEWYGRWSSGDLPTYQSRRAFVRGVFGPLENLIQTGRDEVPAPTGWPRVDRTVGELRARLASARNEEQFQAVGLLAREALISVAQAVFVTERHPPLDGVPASDTDAKRMLEAYIAVELAGGANEDTRQHAKSALSLALALQHKRTAAFRDAAMCVEATTSVINLVAIVSGLRDPGD